MWEFVDELLKICHSISRWSIRWRCDEDVMKICHSISRWSIRWRSVTIIVVMKYSMKMWWSSVTIIVVRVCWWIIEDLSLNITMKYSLKHSLKYHDEVFDEVLSLNCCDEDSMKSKKSCEKIIKHVTNIVSWFANTFVEMNNPHHEVCRWRFYRRVCWSVCWRCVSVCLLKMWWRKGWSMLLK